MKYKIKWERNRKVEKNSKINSTDIVKDLKRSLRKKGVAGVRLHDMRKKYPMASVFFSDVDSFHINQDKAHTRYSRLIAHIDTNPKSLTIEFSSGFKNPLEIMKVIKEVIEIVQCQKESTSQSVLIPSVQG